MTFPFRAITRKTFLFLAFLLPMGAGLLAQADANTLYQGAYSAMLDESYDQAETGFLQVIERFPRSDWVDDSHFWICFTRAKQAVDLESAFSCFETFVLDFPKSSYVKEAQARLVSLGQALAREGKPRYAEKVRGLRESQDEELALMTLRALQNIGDREALDAIMKLYNQSGKDKIRRQIAMLLPEFEAPEVTGYLITIARNDASTDVRRRAIYALAERPGDQEALDYLKSVVMGDDEKELRKAALYALGDAGLPGLGDLLTNLALGDDEAMAKAAIYAMEETGEGISIATLRDIYQKSNLKGVRRAILHQAAEAGDAEALGFLKDVLFSDSPVELRRTALYAMAELGLPEASTIIKDLAFKADDPSLARAALHALAESGDGQAVNLVIQILREHPEPSQRRAAAWSLAEMEVEQAVAELKRAAIEDTSGDVKRAATSALGEIGSPSAKQALLEILEHSAK